MKQNDKPNIQQLLSNKEALQQVAQSPEAKALASMLANRDQASLQKIAEKATKGDTRELNQLIASIASSPGGAQLLQKLSKRIEK